MRKLNAATSRLTALCAGGPAIDAVMTMPTMLDLFSGLGGASQVMRERGWRVISVDIEQRFRPTIVADVGSLPLRPFHVDLLWASPPCVEFAQVAMPWTRKHHPSGIPDISLARRTAEIISLWQPQFWIVENTIHARKWITPHFGQVRAMIAGHYFWGKLPGLLPDCRRRHKESMSSSWAAERAKIPIEISEAV